MRKANVFSYSISFLLTLLLLGVGKEVSAIVFADTTSQQTQVSTHPNSDNHHYFAQFESVTQAEEPDSSDDSKNFGFVGDNFPSSNFSFKSQATVITDRFYAENLLLNASVSLFILFQNLRI